MQYKIDKILNILHQRFINSDLLHYWGIGIVVFMIAFIILLTIRRILRKSGKMSGGDLKESFALALAIAYYYLAYSYTILVRPVKSDYLVELRLFWSYYEAFNQRDETTIFWILVNLTMFIPIGFLLKFAFRKMKWWKACGIGLVLSYTIEISQLLLQRGNFELFDDPINNMVGCLVGYWIGCLMHRLFSIL